MKTLKRIALIFLSLIVVLIAVIVIGLVKLDQKTKAIDDDYQGIYTNTKYEKAIMIDNISVIKQDISCGYAVIEMFAKYLNNDIVTESYLYDTYGKVVTSTGKSFAIEMNKQFKDYHTVMYKYLKNTDFIDKVYNILASGMPVPFEWAAKYDEKWTLHYSLIIGIDIPNDKVTVANPYGYLEEITIKELLDRTSFNAYENMPLFFKLGFAFNVFEKNTLFIVDSKK